MRGIAAIMVMLSHFLERTPLRESWFLSHINLGQFGVVVFFIISGMVIPYSLNGSKNTIKKFIVSRFFRLYPVYWVSVFLAVVSAIFFLGYRPDTKIIVLNLTMIQSLLRVPDLFGVYWTLAIELLFYFSCALLFYFGLIKNNRSNFILSILLIAIAVLFSYVRFVTDKKIPVAIPLSMSLMFFGSVWREATVNMSKVALKYCLGYALVFLTSIPLICSWAYSKSYGFGENPVSYMVTYCGAFCFFILMTTKIKIYHSLFVWLGTISYSVYLLHPFVLEMVNSQFDLAKEFNFYYFIFYVVMVLILSNVAYLVIEKNSISLGKKIRKTFD